MKAPPVWESGDGPAKKGGTSVVWIVIGAFGLVACLFCVLGSAVLFPVFAKARSVARRGGCLRNMKELSAASLLYASSNDEHFEIGSRWMDSIANGSVSERRFKCPAITSGYGYSMNAALSSKGRATILQPGGTPLIFEGLDTSRNAVGNPRSDTDRKRHGNGSNVGYADGHSQYSAGRL